MILSDLITTLSMGAPCCVEIDNGIRLVNVCNWKTYSQYVDKILAPYMEYKVTFIYVHDGVLGIQIVNHD